MGTARRQCKEFLWGPSKEWPVLSFSDTR